MERRQKIMRLVIDALSEKVDIAFSYERYLTSPSGDLFLLEYTAKRGDLIGNFNISGSLEPPITLAAQYDPSSMLADFPAIQVEIQQELDAIARRISRFL